MVFEKTLDSRMVYEGKIVNLRVDTVELPDGNRVSREVVEHSGAVAVVAVDDEQNVFLVKQYRYPVQNVLLEIPAGKMEAGEEPLQCAQRELKEETGLIASQWQFLFRFYSTPGFTNEELYIYLARGLRSGKECSDADEFLQVVKVPFKNTLVMIEKGEICDAKSIAGLLWSRELLLGEGLR